MIKKILKWVMIITGALVILVLIFFAIVYINTQSRINKVYQVNLESLTIPTDSASYELGKHVAQNRGCLGCHGHNLAGLEPIIPEGSPLGLLYARNITSGKGGLQYTDKDWIRVLRHGLNKENKSVWFMPSHEIYHITNEEMGALISFIKQHPPVDKQWPAKSIKPFGRLLVFLDEFPLFPAEKINHEAVIEETITPTVTPEYGAYLATICRGCHGPEYKGAPAHGPKEPATPNISSTGNIKNWKEGDFITALRSGKTPEGKQLSDAMPFKEFTFTTDELKSIFLYLQQVK